MTSQFSSVLFANKTMEMEEISRFRTKENETENVTSLACDVIAHDAWHRLTSWLVTYLLAPYLLLRLSCWLWEVRMTRLRDPRSALPLPGGRMGLPLLGEMPHILAFGSSYQRRRRKEFGPIYRTHIWGSPTIVVMGAENVKKILLGEGRLVTTRWPSTTRRILGTHGIVNGDRETHHKMKRLALKAFSPKYVELYAPVIKAGVAEHLDAWQRSGVVSALEGCKQMVSQTMMSVLLGIPPTDPDAQLYIRAADDIINSILSLPLDVPGSAFRKGLRARDLIFRKLESSLRSKLCGSDAEGHSVLLSIIRLSRALPHCSVSLRNLQNLSLEFIFAGTQSLQCSAASMLVHLSQRPQIVDRLREEISREGLWGTPLSDISSGRLEGLPLLDAVVKETLRVTPTIPGAIRVALKTFELGGFQIPKGWQVVYSIRMTHEEISGNILQDGPVCQFDPDVYFNCSKCQLADKNSENIRQKQADSLEDCQRGEKTKLDFKNGNTGKKGEIENDKTHVCDKTVGPYNFIPFGKGGRMCAGQNYGLLFLRCLLFQLVRTSNVELASKSRFVEIPMTKPHKSVAVKVTPFVLK